MSSAYFTLDCAIPSLGLRFGDDFVFSVEEKPAFRLWRTITPAHLASIVALRPGVGRLIETHGGCVFKTPVASMEIEPGDELWARPSRIWVSRALPASAWFEWRRLWRDFEPGIIGCTHEEVSTALHGIAPVTEVTGPTRRRGSPTGAGWLVARGRPVPALAVVA